MKNIITNDYSNQSKIKVSAIVSTYNSEKFIYGCLNDLINQSLFIKGNLEIVIIDSGSDQNEAKIVKRMQRKFPNRIIYERTNRETLYTAWNRGIKLARGKYITNANADDRHHQNALEIMVEALDKQPETALVYSDCYVSTIPNETYEQNSHRNILRFPDFFPAAALLHYQFGPQPMWRKSVHDKIGYFDGTFHAAGDYDFNIRFALKFTATHIPEPLGLYLTIPSTISFRDNRMENENKRISTIYHKTEIVEELYKAAKIPCETNEEKALALLDMGIRATKYYPPWLKGKTEKNINLATICFLKATELTTSLPAAYNNLAVTLFNSGYSHEAIKILNFATRNWANFVIENNQRFMNEYTGGDIELQLIDSKLGIPTQESLANSNTNFTIDHFKSKKLPPKSIAPASDDKKMRGSILLVAHGFPPSVIGGTQIYVEALAKQLHQNCYTVMVLTPKHRADYPEGYIHEYEKNGIFIAEINIIPEKKIIDKIQFKKRFYNEDIVDSYKKYLLKTKPDLVHFHHFIGLSGAALEATHDLNIPTAITLHDGWFFCDQYHFILPDGKFCNNGPISSNQCADCFKKRNQNIIKDYDIVNLFEERKKYLMSSISLADTVILPSKFLLKKLSTHGFAHPNAIVNQLGLSTKDTPILQSNPSGKIRFAYLGHIIPVKGLDILLRAANLINNNNAQIDIYGHILDKKFFESATKNLYSPIKINFYGKFSPADLPNILGKIDVAIIPSRTESFCFTARECLHAGIPVIASDSGALPEIIKDGINGILFKSEDHNDLAKKINSILEKKSIIESLRKNIKPIKSIIQEANEIINIYSDTITRKNFNASPLQYDASNLKLPPKLIAFHLPQYHPIPENDLWWGKGFTEWTNVAKARPLFNDHYQPHIPADLGFYDLRLPATRTAQADLAREYGIHGFCYYHYWFNGKLLLEQPVHDMLQSGEPDFPFCLCWANENWTRVWDGESDNVLMEQIYNSQDDIEHIQYMFQFFRDSRYIRVNDRPLFLIYRASRLPNPQETCHIWREEARKAGIGELYLCRVESFRSEHSDPVALGFDAAIEFQPDWSRLGQKLSSPEYGNHSVYKYEAIVRNMSDKPVVRYTRFPCVTPSWDNSPRKPHEATVLQDATPELYGKWLHSALLQTQAQNPEIPFVFINAWNEWGEGNHLEPDLKFGRAFLEETKNALNAVRQIDTVKVQAKPCVSIIIPVFNNLKFTKQCLMALIEATPEELYEVVIIDNGSTDGTDEFLSCLDGDIHIISNKKNVGFARACNQGASIAQGHYLVFLNNDTIPQSGWLTELVSFMDSHPKAGIAGSKLLYPDDTIQHCGATMRFDGGFFRHPYKYLHRNHPLVNRVRELDAVTAACFITPRELFCKLGKFDEHYLNGCEDMDYCTAVRRSDATIHYVPTSELYHLESQTPRPEDKDHENFQRYLGKWGKAAMKNEVEIYAQDGFWIQNGNHYSPSPDAVTMLKDLGLNFNPSCPTPAETFQKIVKRIFPSEHWSKDV